MRITVQIFKTKNYVNTMLPIPYAWSLKGQATEENNFTKHGSQYNTTIKFYRKYDKTVEQLLLNLHRGMSNHIPESEPAIFIPCVRMVLDFTGIIL